MKKLVLLLGLISITTNAQVLNHKQEFTRQDSLRGTNNEFRNWWDVKKYKVSVEPDYQSKSIKGKTTIIFDKTAPQQSDLLQIDLQDPMMVSAVKLNGKKISDFKRDGNVYFINVGKNIKNTSNQLELEYNGNPRVAVKAPWDGGWIFEKDHNGNPWITAAQEGIGASVWLPIKDIWNDEPDNGILMKIVTPKDLVGVGNGRLISKATENGKNIFTWEVKNPINAYSIIPSVGKYVNFNEVYDGEKGKLDMDYWVLDYNFDKAKKQFTQAKPMMKAFEYWFGPYPFYEDSYKLVESPHLGMEHQSNVAYGNGFKNGYLGRDLSGTGVGLNWDFILIHESGHEWFANNITAKDQADMWIHEGFTCYSETLFTEKFMDKKSAETYVQGLRHNIRNDVPIIGKYGVRKAGSGDMYYKGANMLHTIRQVINDDEKFRQILRGLNKDFYHQTVTTKQIEDYINLKSGIDFSSVFNQYLRTTKIPTLEYSQKGKVLKYRYTNVVENFKLPLRINGNQKISPTEKWQTLKLKSAKAVELDGNYYVAYKKM